MNFWLLMGQLSLAFALFFFLLFILTSALEKEKRAFLLSLLGFLIVLGLELLFWTFPTYLKTRIFGLVFVATAAGLALLFLTPKPRQAIKITGEQDRVDERDVIFARFDLEEGSASFRDYYSRQPDFKKMDDEIRKIPDILTLSHQEKNSSLFSLASAEFDFLEHLLDRVEGSSKGEKNFSSPEENTRVIKEFVCYLGSEACGVCFLDPAYVYSHVGRGPEVYGLEIKLAHKYAVVFALEMDLAMVACAPEAPTVVETGKRYIQGAMISIILADFIRRSGWPARAHIAGSNYQAILPPLGWKAGLGELGRLGILITDKYGPRARLGLVTTDFPLLPDKPKVRGVQDFCARCQKCARNCPAQAIPSGEKREERGVYKWVLDREKCYRYWRKVGTDCAMCLYVCPYSHPHSLFHQTVRRLTEESSLFQAAAVWADDLFYGKRRPRGKPPFRL